MKNFIKKLLSIFGWHLLKTEYGFIVQKKHLKPESYEWLRSMQIRTIIDVGAHIGQFSLQMSSLFPNADFYVFEPLKDSFNELKDNLKHVPNIRMINEALGDQQGPAVIQKSEFSPSSSIRKMDALHKKAYPHTKNTIEEQIEVNTLDHYFSSVELSAPILVKIDVQGYEDMVIKGAKKTLEHVNLIVLETSFYKLYEDQPLFSEIYKELAGMGFSYAGSWGQWKDPRDGAILQQDAIFMRRG